MTKYRFSQILFFIHILHILRINDNNSNICQSPTPLSLSKPQNHGHQLQEKSTQENRHHNRGNKFKGPRFGTSDAI